MASPNVFAQLVQPLRSVTDYSNDLDRREITQIGLEGQRRQNALAALTVQQTRDQIADTAAKRNALQTAYASLPANADPLTRARALQANPLTADQGVAAEKAALENDKSRAATAKDQAEADAKGIANRKALLEHGILSLQTSTTPQEAARQVQQGVAQGYWTMQDAQAKLSAIPQDQAQFEQWRANQLRAVTEAYRQLPTIQTVDLGGRKVTQAVDPISGKPTVTGSQVVTQSPDSIATNATSRANNAATIAKDLQIAGMSPDGKGVNGNVEEMAKAIAAGKAAPITGFALAKPQGQTVMRRVFELNPNYDETTYAAKIKAAKDFGSGSQGNAMRSFNVAGQHLDQLGELVDALGNRDLQIVNRVANAYREQTGNPAPTNFDAAKDVVSKEVVKAIVAGGGGVAERQELADLMSKAKSPAQLKGVIQQYRGLMSAQHDALLQQRRAAGLTDETLPNYGGSHGKPAKSKTQEAADAIINGGG